MDDYKDNQQETLLSTKKTNSQFDYSFSQNADNDESLDMSTFKEYPYRWVNFTIFLFYVVANAAYTVALTTITDQVGKAYDVSNTMVYLVYAVTAFGYLLLAFPTNWLIENKGVHITIVLSSVITFIGVWIRQFINHNFWFVIIGNFVGALGRACSTHAAPKVALNWWLPSNRSLISSLMLISAPVGYIVGFQMTTFMVTETSEEHPVPSHQTKSEIYDLFWYQNIATTIVLVLSSIFYKEKPPVAPSHAAGKKGTGMAVGESVSKLFKTPAYLAALFYVSMCLAIYGTFSASMSDIIEPFGFTSTDASNFMSLTLIVGMVGVVMAGIIQKLTGKYKLPILINCFGFLGSLGLMCFVLNFNNPTLLYANGALNGFFLAPSLTLGIEFACEVGFPVGEAYSNGLIQIVGNIMTMVFVVCLTKLLDNTKNSSYSLLFIITAIVVIGAVFIIAIKEDLKRTKYETYISRRQKEADLGLKSTVHKTDVKDLDLGDKHDIKALLTEEEESAYLNSTNLHDSTTGDQT